MVSDADPYFDACADKTSSAAQGGRNIGDLRSVVRFIEDNWNLGRIGGSSTDTGERR